MLGRVFNDKNELLMVYSNYAQEEIFSVKIRSSNMEEDGKFKYITLACSYLGKKHSVAKNYRHPQSSKKD